MLGTMRSPVNDRFKSCSPPRIVKLGETSKHISVLNIEYIPTSPVAHDFPKESGMMSNLRSPAASSLSPRDGRSPEASAGSELTNAAEMASKTNAGLDDVTTEDARSLGLLVSFLSPSYRINHDFLLRGGSLRKRWTPDGGIQEVDATTAGLSPELTSLLSDPLRLRNALSALSTTVLKESDQAYILDAEAAKRIRLDLSTEALASWKTQVLIVAYRACPWKYIELRLVLNPVFESHSNVCSRQK